MSKKQNVPNTVTVPVTIAEMENLTLEKMGLTSIPSNKDTGASGKYNAWSREQRDYNDTVVRPFRENVATLLKSALESAIKAGDAERVFELMVTGLTYVDKQSKLFYNPQPATHTQPATITDDTLLKALMARGISEDVAKAMLSK